MAVARRRYSDGERARALAALAAHGGDIKATARDLDIPERTLNHWANGHGIHPDVARDGEAKKGDLADACEEVAWKLVGVARDKADRLGAKDAMVAFGVAVDKMQLLRGKPTGITRDGLSDAERAERLAALLDRARARRDGRAAAGGPAGDAAGGPGPDPVAGGTEARPVAG